VRHRSFGWGEENATNASINVMTSVENLADNSELQVPPNGEKDE